MRIVCPKCGTEIPNIEAPCPKCGFTSEDFQRQVRHEQFLENKKKENKGDLAGKAFIILLLIIAGIAALINFSGDSTLKGHEKTTVYKDSNPGYSRAPVMIAKINKGFADLGWGQSPKATKKLKLKKTDDPVHRYEPVDYILQSHDTQLLGITASYYPAPPSFWFYRNKLLSIQAFYADADKVMSELNQTFDRPDYTQYNGFKHGINIWNLEKVRVKFVPLNEYCVLYVNHKSLVKSLNDERRKHNLEDW